MRSVPTITKACLVPALGLGLVLGSSAVASANPATSQTSADASAPGVASPTIGSPANYRYGEPYTATGTAEPSSDLWLSIDDELPVRVRVSPDGTWSHTFRWIALSARQATLHAGTARLELRADPDEHAFTIAPDAVWDGDADQITIHGTGTPGDFVSTAGGTVVVEEDGQWSLTLRAFEQYRFTATVQHRGQSVTQSFTNPDAPALSELHVTSETEFERGEFFTITGTAEPNVSVSVSQDGKNQGYTHADESGRWEFRFLSNDDEPTLTFRAFNHEDLTVPFTAKGGPLLAVTSDKHYTRGESFTVRGTTKLRAAVEVHQDGKRLRTVHADAEGVWEYSAPGTSADSVTLTFTTAGLEDATETFTAKRTPFAVTSPSTGSTVADNANTVTWTGTAPAGTPVRVATTGGRTIATTKTDSTGTWAARGTLAYDLMYTVNISAVIDGDDTMTEHQVKVIKPFQVTSPTSGATVSDSANAVTWTGTAPAGTPIRVATTGGRTIATTKTDTTGRWAARGTLAYDLMYTVTITATIDGKDTMTEHQVKVTKP